MIYKINVLHILSICIWTWTVAQYLEDHTNAQTLGSERLQSDTPSQADSTGADPDNSEHSSDHHHHFIIEIS